MKNFVSNINHVESAMSASTIKAMLKQAKQLETTHFSIADQGHMASCLKTYRQCLAQDIKPILGVQIYFKDNDCDIIKNTESAKIKYFTIALHALDQHAYQELVRLISERRQETCEVRGFVQNLYNFKDLKYLSQFNIIASTTDIESMVAKHLLVKRADLAFKYYTKLKEIFGNNFYPSLIAYKYDKYWDTIAEIELGGKKVSIPSEAYMETDKYHYAKVSELGRRHRHKKLKTLFINGFKYPIKKEHQEIGEAKLSNVFADMPDGDVNAKANKLILAIALKSGDIDRVLLNSYSHYADKEDKIVQNMKLGDALRYNHTQHMRSTEELMEYLNSMNITNTMIDKFVNNTLVWAERFNDFKLEYQYRLPDPETDSPAQKLMDIIKATGRMKWDDEVYRKQLKEELVLLSKNGVVDLIPYFLPIVDVYKHYEENGRLTGSGRGSVGGLLIAYLIGITHIDPIKYKLSSARFLTLDRVQQGGLPDIDCDLSDRELLVGEDGNGGFLFNKYGKKAAQISTRTLLRVKSAILDVNRFINGSIEPEVAKMTKTLPNTPPNTNDLEFVMGYEDEHGNHVPGLIDTYSKLKEYSTSRPKEWEIVLRALSLSRQFSRHACSFVISNADIEETTPIMEVGEVKRVTQCEHADIEASGLIKYDFLVVSQLKDIQLAIEYINKKNNHTGLKTGYFYHNNKETFIWDLPEDKDVFNMLSRGETETVFQLHSSIGTKVTMDVRPESIMDCAIITSLGRPGPLGFVDETTGRNMAEEFAARKRGESKGQINILNEMLPETYGVIVLQEQISYLAKELAGMNVEDAENVRIAVGKKKQKLIDSLKPKFVEGAAKKVGQETAEKIWDMMDKFASYGFNKSHAVAYAATSYACAFLKYHYPLEWWAAILSNAPDKEINEEYFKYVKDILTPPDINLSTEKMVIDYDNYKIRHKLSIIRGLGTSLADRIAEGRPYKDIKDFIAKKVCGNSMAKKLIRVGVLDSLYAPRTSLYEKIHIYNQTVAEVDWEKKLAKYDIKMEDAETEKEKEKIMKQKLKLVEKGPNKIAPDTSLEVSPIEEYLIKKSIFPTMPIDIMSALKKKSKLFVEEFSLNGKTTYFVHKSDRNGKMREYCIYDSKQLQKVESEILDETVYFAMPGYVMETKQFMYQNDTKTALKMVVDFSGYITEKVLWPDYNTGELKYPESLKKGSVAWFFFYKKAEKEYLNILDIEMES